MTAVRRIALALLLAATALAGPAAAVDLRKVEVVGAAPVRDDDRSGAPREAAVQRALREAVQRVALQQVPDVGPGEADGVLAEVLGNDPLLFVSRYRVVEDRGARPALFTRDPNVEKEHVVVVEVHVAADRVRTELVRAGLLLPSGDSRRARLYVVVESETFGGYAAVRRSLLQGVGVRTALPVEMAPERAVLAVDAEGDAQSLLEALLRAAEPGLEVTPVRTDGGTLVVRVDYVAPPEPPPVGARGRAKRRRN